MAADPIWNCVGGCAIAASLSVALGALLRGCGLRRAWVLSGLLVGVLLGPLALARVRESWFDRLYHGAAPQRRELFVAERVIEVASLTAAPRGAAVDADDLAKLEAEREAVRERLHAARQRFDEPALWIVAVLASLACAAGSPLAGRIAWWRDGGAPIGAMAVAAPAALLVTALAFGENPQARAWWLDLAAITCVGSACMLPRERWIAVRLVGRLAPGIDAARAAAGVMALMLVAVARCIEGEASIAWLMPWGVLLAVWGLAAPVDGWPRRLAAPAAGAAVAIALTRIDPLENWKPWFALAVFVAAEDLKWLGAATGLSMWGHVRWFRALRACMPLADASSVMGALAAVAMLGEIVPAWACLAALVSAAAVETLEPVRRGTALSLDATIHGERADGA